MELDFTGLYAPHKPQEAPARADVPPGRGNAAEGHTAPQEAAARPLSLERAAEERQRVADEYKRQQEATIKTAALRTEILKGLRAGEPLPVLFLKAIECAGLAIGDMVFIDQSRGDLLSVYGIGLQEPEAAAVELGEVRARLDNLERAYKRDWPSPEDKQRIATAIRAHREREAHLQAIVGADQNGHCCPI